MTKEALNRPMYVAYIILHVGYIILHLLYFSKIGRTIYHEAMAHIEPLDEYLH